MMRMTLEEWITLGEKLFGKDRMEWRFVCPSCSHVASVKDWKDAGAPVGEVAFSCIGRRIGASNDNTFGKKGGPCTYAGGGFFKLNPVEVIDKEGRVHSMFDFYEL